MSIDNNFLATGENGAQTGFETTRDASFKTGVIGTGSEIGVSGSSSAVGVMGTGNVGVHGDSHNRGVGVKGSTRGEYAVFGLGINGVYGKNALGEPGRGVIGDSSNSDGVFGRSQARDGSGVFGLNDAGEEARSGGPDDAPVHPPGVSERPGPGGGPGVTGISSIATGVVGIGGSIGVFGKSSGNGDGVSGLSEANGRSGVFGHNTQTTGVAFGVVGRCESPDGQGVGGSGPGVGVRGDSRFNDGVIGRTEGGSGRSGVFGENVGRVQLISGPSGPLASPCGVTGRADHGDGISGHGGRYGGVFEGSLAPLRLVPSPAEGAPSTGLHQAGEFFVDSSGNLFFCTKASTAGTPATWMRVQLVPVP